MKLPFAAILVDQSRAATESCLLAVRKRELAAVNQRLKHEAGHW